MSSDRRRFLPVVAAGVLSAGLLAVVGHQPWARASGSAVGTAGSAFSSLTTATEAGRVPGATALALVVLACWGVVLVTRGRVRRVVAVLGLVAAVASVAAVVVGLSEVVGDVRDAYASYGITDITVHRSAWSFLAPPLAVVAVVSCFLAVRWVPTWPEMGRRYDAPEGAPASPSVAVGDQQDDLSVWKAINEGRDPTA